MRANQQINKLRGLGIVSRGIIAFFSTFFGIGLIITEWNGAKSVGVYAIGIFCLIVGFVCITRGHIQKFFGSIIGSTVFIASIMYIYFELKTGNFLSHNRSEPSLFNAILFFIVFGLAGLSYTTYAKFGIKKKDKSTPKDHLP